MYRVTLPKAVALHAAEDVVSSARFGSCHTLPLVVRALAAMIAVDGISAADAALIGTVAM